MNVMPLSHSAPFTLYKNVWFTKSTTYIDGEARLNYVNWYLHGANALKIVSTHVVFSSEVCFISVDTGIQRIHVIPLHGIKVHAWCPTSANRTNGAIFFSETINSQRYVTHVVTPILVHLSDYEGNYYFSLSSNRVQQLNHRQLSALFR
jgi:hypothetical protein